MGKFKQLIQSVKKREKLKTKAKKPRIELKKQLKKKHFVLRIEEFAKVLLVGEGNFSFAQSLALKFQNGENLVCTALDSKESTLFKYPESEEILDNLSHLESNLEFEIDATDPLISSNLADKYGRFDYIIFNFPHAGQGIKDEAKNIKSNQDLIGGFMKNCIVLLKQTSMGDDTDGRVVITIKGGILYEKWNIKSIGKSMGYVVERSMGFDPKDYPGYCHRRTIGYDSRKSSPDNEEITKFQSRMYIFKLTNN